MNFRLLITALLISTIVSAQETQDTEEQKTKTQEESQAPGKNVGSIALGPYFPIAFGDNFANNGMDLKMGARFSFKVNAYQGFYIGPYFSFFNGSVNTPQLLGNYTETTNTVIGGMIGYEKHINKFDINLGIGVGASTYINDGRFINFRDTATTVWINPEVSYRLTTYLGLYFAPELRHDFMNIDTPPEIQDMFKGVNYFNISFGLRINLGTAYKYF
ncbi:hypothetical protein [Aequorivita marina]|uniref:hypothetical protein n=1 Tax=Aequorivita marina TaxID=3073654 RepID=UPI002875E820|nr:hypothetical protein [Aequorivita sp. S2608]MDS1299360.1 hypothetical protein [Aequorivita sp. S2608]